ncbi:hypothetical protein WDW89_21385, partial [Deltaproteobacteria bacterium TL4]
MSPETESAGTTDMGDVKSIIATILGVPISNMWDIFDTETGPSGDTLCLINITVPLFNLNEIASAPEDAVEIAHKIRGAVVDVTAKKIVIAPRYYLPVKTIPDSVTAVTEGIEGTTIRVFVWQQKCFFSTCNKLHAELFRWDTSESFGSLFVSNFGDWRRVSEGTFIIGRQKCFRLGTEASLDASEQARVLEGGGFLVCERADGSHFKVMSDKYNEKLNIRGNDPNFLRRFYRLSSLSLPKNCEEFKVFMGSEFEPSEPKEFQKRLSMIASRFKWATGVNIPYVDCLYRDRNEVVRWIMTFYGRKGY